MDGAAFTYLLFAGAVAAGAACLRHSLTLGDKAPSALRWTLRCFLGLLVFLAVWGEGVYALWTLGVPLIVGSVASGRIHEAWWFGPAACTFAMIAYGLLREDTTGDRGWRFSRTIGGAVLIGLGALAVIYGMNQMPNAVHASDPKPGPGTGKLRIDPP